MRDVVEDAYDEFKAEIAELKARADKVEADAILYRRRWEESLEREAGWSNQAQVTDDLLDTMMPLANIAADAGLKLAEELVKITRSCPYARFGVELPRCQNCTDTLAECFYIWAVMEVVKTNAKA